jgi:type II secretory pathway component GspD/PulD (secretin)
MTETTHNFRSRRAGALVLLLLGSAMALAQDLQIIELHYHVADEVMPALQPLLEPGDVLTGMGDKLFVRASPATLARIVQAIEAVDHPRRQLLITVGQGTVTEIAATELRGSATIASGNVSSGVNRPPGADTSAQFVARDRRQQANLRNVSSVRATEGMQAWVAAGQSVPYTSTAVTPGYYGPTVQQSTQYHDVDSGFYAIGHVSGDVVTLEISPRQQSYDPARGGTIRSAGTQSTVTARLGEWVEIGAVRESGSASNAGVLTWGRHSAGSQYSVWLKVDEVPL